MSRVSVFILLAIGFTGCFLAGCIDHRTPTTQPSMGHGKGIFGGRVVAKGEILSSSVLLIRTHGRNNSLCTGSVIGRRSILTAAHCIIGKSSADIYVPGTPSLEIQSAISHPKFMDRKTELQLLKRWDLANEFDVALLVLKEPLAAPIHAFSTSGGSAFDSALLDIAGFGSESYDHLNGHLVGSPELKHAKIHSAMLRQSDQQPGIFALEQSGASSGFCVGDSGGPLFKEAEGKNLLIAIANSLRNPGSADVCRGIARFVAIEPHRAWIRATQAQFNAD